MNTDKSEVSAAFAREDRSAAEVIARLRDDLTQAKALSPSLVAPLEREILMRVAVLKNARAAAQEHEREGVELARATARRQAALTQLNTSTEVASDAAREIVIEAETAKYLEGAYRRRVDTAASLAAGAFGRVGKDIAPRVAAVRYAESLAGAVVDCEEGRVALPTRADVIAWLPLVLPVEGRAFFEQAHARRIDHPSYPVPPEITEYDAAVKRVFSQIERARTEAAKQAADLGALDFGAAGAAE